MYYLILQIYKKHLKPRQQTVKLALHRGCALPRPESGANTLTQL